MQIALTFRNNSPHPKKTRFAADGVGCVLYYEAMIIGSSLVKGYGLSGLFWPLLSGRFYSLVLEVFTAFTPHGFLLKVNSIN